MVDVLAAQAGRRANADSVSTPFVSVIVPVFDDAAALGKLMQALARQDYPAERFECLVVDNASPEPLHLGDQCPFDLRVVREDRPGSYAARNRGIEMARGSVLAFTDADCIPRTDWLSSAVRAIEGARGSVIIAGQIDVVGHPSRVDSALAWHSVINDLDQRRFAEKYHFAATANMITTKEVFGRIGHFDGRLLSGGDLQWGRRAWAAGIEIQWSGEVGVEHPARATWRTLAAKARRITGGHFAIARRAGRPALATLLLTATIAAASIRRTWTDWRLTTLGRRLGVIGVDLVLRLIQVGEIVRLLLGGQPRRQ